MIVGSKFYKVLKLRRVQDKVCSQRCTVSLENPFSLLSFFTTIYGFLVGVLRHERSSSLIPNHHASTCYGQDVFPFLSVFRKFPLELPKKL